MPGSLRILVAKAAEWVALAVIPVLTAIRLQFPRPLTPTDLGDFFIKGLHDEFAIIVGLFSLLGLAGKALQEVLRAERKSRMKAVLDTLDEACFQGVPKDERYENRVTLFKANWRETKLKAYCRSGTKYQRGIQPLPIHGNNQSANLGVAGQAWFRDTTFAVDGLPDCPFPCLDNNPQCLEYAKRGFLPVDKTGKLRVRSRSLLGTPVRYSNGKQWGVLVLDSRKPDPFTPIQKAFAQSFAVALGKMV